MSDENSEVIDEDKEVSTTSLPASDIHTEPKALAYFSKSSVALIGEFFKTMKQDWQDGNYSDFCVRCGMIGVSIYIAVIFWRISD